MTIDYKLWKIDKTWKVKLVSFVGLFLVVPSFLALSVLSILEGYKTHGRYARMHLAWSAIEIGILGGLGLFVLVAVIDFTLNNGESGIENKNHSHSDRKLPKSRPR
jgi:Sec-independent protein secretion pathway component TatC